jgi:hypothetical protein
MSMIGTLHESNFSLLSEELVGAVVAAVAQMGWSVVSRCTRLGRCARHVLKVGKRRRR